MAKKFNKKAFLTAIVVIFAVAAITFSVFACLYFIAGEQEQMRYVGYITAYNANNEDFTELDFGKVTHVIYGFAYICEDDLPYISDENKVGLRNLSEYLSTNYPNVKFMLSVGGGEGGSFCTATKTAEKRGAFIDALAAICEEYDIDGIDIDWEYPGFRYMANNPYCSTCRRDHASLMEDMRAKFGKDKILSIAMSGNITLMGDLKHNRLKKVLDFVNVMTYDLSKRNHATYSDTASAMFNAYLSGYSREQLNLGLPYYARCGNADYDYTEFDDLESKGDEAKFFEKGNYCYAEYQGQRLSIDTENQVRKKVKLAIKRGYGGVFCWHLGCDFNNTLTNAVYEELNSAGKLSLT